jgi:hypothetical protein
MDPCRHEIVDFCWRCAEEQGHPIQRSDVLLLLAFCAAQYLTPDVKPAYDRLAKAVER